MRLNGATQLLGVIGNPIAHSLSPHIHQIWIEKYQKDAVYVPFFVENLDDFCSWAKKSNLHGFNVTVPYKEKILKYCDYLSDEVKLMGAANTIVNKAGMWQAFNTDAFGFYKSVEQELAWQAHNKTALILGAGGSAKAVVHSLVQNGIEKIILCNRNLQKAADLLFSYQDKCKCEVLEYSQLIPLMQHLPEETLMVNCTSVGLQGESIIPNQFEFNASLKVYDLIYKPETALLKSAKEQGIPAKGGLGMLVYQAAAAFEYFTGQYPKVEYVYEKGKLNLE